MSTKWMKTLNRMEGAVDRDYDPFDSKNILQSPSPSLNWIFGKGSGLPFGYGAILFGPPKSGKSLVANLFTGALHQQDPKAIAVKFNTEMREAGQMEDYWKIDPERYQAFDVNEPEYIFDRIKNEILPMIEEGMPLKLIIIDSLQGVQGVRESGKESIKNRQIGDHALTIQEGLKMILPTIRRHNIALICTAHVRGNLDSGMYGPKEKMAGGWAQKHFFEYFIEVKRNGASASKIEDNEVKDFKGKKEILGHKIFVKMTESSVGVAGRTGQFTLNYSQGLVGTEEEILELAKNLKLVERPNNRTYIVDGQNYTSKQDFMNAIEEDKELRTRLLNKIYENNKP